MTLISKWAEDCYQRGILVYLMQEKDDKKLFITKEKPNNDPHGRAPIYQVWQGDKRIYCGISYDIAKRYFND